MVLHKHSLTSFQNDVSTVEIIKESFNNSREKKKTLLKNAHIKVKLFFWNLSPLHWYDGFKQIKIDLIEFECKK